MPHDNPFYSKPDSQRYFSTASAPSRWATEQINELTGGNDIRPGAMDVSPETIDLMWNTATGGAGHFLLNTMDSAYRLAAPGKEVESENLPFIRKLRGREYPSSDFEMYYDRKDRIEVLQREMRTLRGEERLQALLLNANERRMIPRLKAVEKRLKILRKRKDRLKAHEASDKQIEAVDDLITQQIKQFNGVYNRVVLE